MNNFFNKKTFYTAFLLLAIALFTVTACVGEPAAQGDGDSMAEATEAPAEEAMAEDEAKGEKPHWGYVGEEGPQAWGNLSADWAVCGTGVEQSPIDLMSPDDADLADIVFNYSESAVTVLNNGHTIQANYDAGSSIDLDGEAFNLLQFHMHAKSEHTLEGAYFPLEIHLVHQAESGQLAVVGIMVQEGDANEALAAVWDNMPTEKTDPMMVDGAMMNAADFLPADQSSFRYMGSLTTPPCSEQVRWHVLTSPITMSADQIGAFTSIFDNNFRPIQALNERTLIIDQASN